MGANDGLHRKKKARTIMTTSTTIERPTDRRNRKPAPAKRIRGGKPPGYKLTTRDRRKNSEIRWAAF